MSRYRLRGRVGLCDDPDPYSTAYEPSSLSTDFHWEFGYNPDRVSYFALLYDDVPDEDPDYPDPAAASHIMKAIGWSRGVDSVEELQAEMEVDLPPLVIAALRDERERHFGGQLGEPADQVRSRWLRMHGAERGGTSKLSGHSSDHECEDRPPALSMKGARKAQPPTRRASPPPTTVVDAG